MRDFPIFAYTLPGGFLVLSVLSYAVEQRLSRTNMWRKIPWGWIVIGTAIFLAGQVYADALNPHSQLRRWYRGWWSPFEIVSVATDHKMGASESAQVWMLIKFKQNLKGPSLIVRIITGLPSGKNITKTVLHDQLSDVAKDSELRIKIAELAIPKPGWTPHPSYWANDKNNSITPNSKNIVEVEINDSHHRFYVEFLDAGRGDVRRIYVLTEGTIPVELLQ